MLILLKLIIRSISLLAANAWEDGDEVILITCRLNNLDLDQVNGHQSDKLEDPGNELYVYLEYRPFILIPCNPMLAIMLYLSGTR